MINEDKGIRERVVRFGFPVDILPQVESWTSEDGEAAVKVASQNGCDVVAVDSHEAHADYLTQLRDAGLYVIKRDDLAPYPFPCQMVINGNADACELPYSSSSGDTLFLLGPEYVALRQEFWGSPPRAMGANVQNILVTLGGTDQHNLMPKLLGLLDGVPGDFAVTAVIGPFFHNVAAVESVAESAKRPIGLVQSPDSLYELMLRADMAISAGGQTLYELACLGCPTIAIKTVANQDRQLTAMADAGFLWLAGDAVKDDIIPTVEEALLSLLADPKARVDMATEGQRLVDGKGALRAAQRILTEGCSLSTRARVGRR